MSGLITTSKPQDDIDALRSRIVQLDALLAERDAEVTQLKAGLEAFRIRYRQDVGLLYEQLDELEKAIDEAEQGVRVENPKRVHDDSALPSPDQLRIDVAPKFTTDAVRKLFRDVAKAIHPDLAGDDPARDRRHTLMVEANRAYALGDEARLRSILQAWHNSPEAVSGSDAEAVRLRLVRRIAQIDEQLEACASELADLKASSLWHLKAMVDDAAAGGKDLVADMVRRLKRDLLVAQNRLDAIQWRPDSQS